MRRIAVAAVLAAAAGLAACSATDVKAEDAYKIGCPAIDSAAAGGTVASKATVSGLRALRDSGELGTEPQKWVEAAIAVLTSDDPKAQPSQTKQLIISGCADHGYPLRNLT